MSIKTRELFPQFPWDKYSTRLSLKIDNPRCAGCFTAQEAEAKQLRLITVKEGTVESGSCVQLYWLVDETDGVIVDARFQAYGQSSLIGSCQLACEMLPGKNYRQAEKIYAEHLDIYARDRQNVQAFPEDTYPYMNLVVDAIMQAASYCHDIQISTPSPFQNNLQEPAQYEADPMWEISSQKERLALIEAVLDKEIRPFVALDEGGVEIVSLEEFNLTIAYQGNCTSCASSTGSTLTAIQEMLRQKVHPSIVVIPDLSTLGGSIPNIHE